MPFEMVLCGGSQNVVGVHLHVAINVQSQMEDLCDTHLSHCCLCFVDITVGNFVSPVTLCVYIGYIFGLSKYSNSKADECRKDTKLSVSFFIIKIQVVLFLSRLKILFSTSIKKKYVSFLSNR